MPYSMTVDWGDTDVDKKAYPSAGRYTLAHSYKAPGLYNGFITVEDSDKVKNVHHFAVRVTSPLSLPRIDTAVEWLLLGFAGLLSFQVAVSYVSSIRKRR